MKIIFMTLLMMLSLTHVNAGDVACDFDAVKTLDGIVVKKECRKKYFKIKYDILGFNVNCKKNKILVWGKPLRLNSGNTQDSMLTIIDIDSKRKVDVPQFKNIYGAYFLKNESLGVIESHVSSLLDLNAGKIIAESNEMQDLEVCQNFPGKFYSKYRIE